MRNRLVFLAATAAAISTKHPVHWEPRGPWQDETWDPIWYPEGPEHGTRRKTRGNEWSGGQDLNLRLLRPEDCVATLSPQLTRMLSGRHRCYITSYYYGMESTYG